MSAPVQPSRSWERYAWAAGIVYVAALVAESVIATGIGLDHNDSAAKIASRLQEHRTRELVISYFSTVYAAGFAIYLWRLHDLVRRDDADSGRSLAPLVLIGGLLFVSLHAVSDIGLTGFLGAKLSTYSAQHDPGLSYTIYYVTYALDSVGDVFGSLFAAAAGVFVLRSAALPRWTGQVILVASPFLFLQAFGLGGVIATYGLALDLVGFVLLLVFVFASSTARLSSRRWPERTTSA